MVWLRETRHTIPGTITIVEKWRIWADTGGTFTDCLAVAPDGQMHRAKVLSSSELRGTIVGMPGTNTVRIAAPWQDSVPAGFASGLPLSLLDSTGEAVITRNEPQTGIWTLASTLPAETAPGATFTIRFPLEAPLLAAHLVTQTPWNRPLPPLDLRVATTRGTNALLTRQGSPPAFFVTAGFGDLLEIGTQQRPDLFALNIVKPTPLQGQIIEVRERLDAQGKVLISLDEAQVRDAARALRAQGMITASVALLHSSAYPIHEERVAQILCEEGFTHVSASSALAPFVKVLPRAQTAVVNAYLAPIIDRYVGAIQEGLPPSSHLHFLTSAGGLVGAIDFHAKDSLLSGPAGGIVGAAWAGRTAGFDSLLAFDMGGTSTDVARIHGSNYEYVWEHTVGDAHLVAPALAIESVAAGGGSICAVDRHGSLRVGPESAGAFPGPACYGAGGPLTVTDVNLLLGRILPDRFGIPLQRSHAQRAADSLLGQIISVTDAKETILEGLLDIANERMSDAIRRVSVRKGYDPATHALVAFGGAGGQHGCAVAARLGMRTVVIPPDASLLSAWGLGHASVERIAEREVLRPLTAETEEEVLSLLDQLEDEARAAVAREGIAGEKVKTRRLVSLRLRGQDIGLSLDFDPDVPLSRAFSERFAQVFGYAPGPDRSVEIEWARVVAASVSDGEANREPPMEEGVAAVPAERARTWFGGAWRDTPVYERESLSVGAVVPGPALVAEVHSVTVVEPGWKLQKDAGGALILSVSGAAAKHDAGESHEAVQTELFASRFTALADEMGETLRRTALSVNVKERLDFSCALLDARGQLVASAAHIPVHLGALGVCVRAVVKQLAPRPGDVFLTNHPAFGGSHLPDVTVILPVFTDDGTLLGYVANRAHHAEIGGTRPGSMPPGARTLAEEGVVLPPMYLVENGVSRLEAVCDRLTRAPYPSRAVGDNRADLEAALAAARQGADRLRRLFADYGPATAHFMEAQQVRAGRLVRAALLRVRETRGSVFTETEYLDDGTPICVAILIAETGDAVIKFSRTAPAHPGNLNATPAIVASAVLYVLRLLVGEDVPLNEGLLRPVRLELPPNCFLNPDFDLFNPSRCPAVVGGNTETSQRIVDTLLKALGLCAASQGTMNNILWGNADFGYYETVCGGAGATPNAPGASSVHTHMTNTRITDTEILEKRYPVRVERFERRRGSGGAGHHPGGDGVVREIRFLAPMSLSVLTQHRTTGPYGMASGEDGQPGRQCIVRETGEIIELGSVDSFDVTPGDRLVLETPGGGGWGSLTLAASPSKLDSNLD